MIDLKFRHYHWSKICIHLWFFKNVAAYWDSFICSRMSLWKICGAVPIMFHWICRRICFTVIELHNVVFFSVNDDIRKISDISSEFVVEERFTPETFFSIKSSEVLRMPY